MTRSKTKKIGLPGSKIFFVKRKIDFFLLKESSTTSDPLNLSIPCTLLNVVLLRWKSTLHLLRECSLRPESPPFPSSPYNYACLQRDWNFNRATFVRDVKDGRSRRLSRFSVCGLAPHTRNAHCRSSRKMIISRYHRRI